MNLFLALSASIASIVLIDLDSIGLVRLFTPLFFLFGPILYAYILSSIAPESSQRKTVLLHSVPAFLVLGFYAVQSVLVLTGRKESLFAIPRWIGMSFWLAFLAHFSGYIIACVGKIRKWKAEHTNDGKYSWDHAWFRFLFILLSSLMYVTISLTLMDLTAFLFSFPRIISSEYVIVLTAAVMVCAISFYSVRTFILGVASGKKTRQQGIPADEGDTEKLEMMKTMMRSKKLYLDPDLSLATLAKATSLTPGIVSRVINTAANENFYDFVHRFRVDDVKASLMDPASADKSILEIAYDCGFNSKSVFNTAFKKYTGKTPREFRNQS